MEAAEYLKSVNLHYTVMSKRAKNYHCSLVVL